MYRHKRKVKPFPKELDSGRVLRWQFGSFWMLPLVCMSLVYAITVWVDLAHIMMMLTAVLSITFVAAAPGCGCPAAAPRSRERRRRARVYTDMD